MKKLISIILIATISCIGFAGCQKAEPAATTNQTSTNEQKPSEEKPEKKAMLVVSFGTTYADTRAVTIEAVEKKLTDAIPDYEFKRAFTSNIIIKKLKERDNIQVDTIDEALEKLKNDGYTDVLVVPTHIMAGIEYDEVSAKVNEYRDEFKNVYISKPILHGTEDYEMAVEALKAQLTMVNDEHAVIFMGHGSEHYANASYSELQYMLWEMGHKNVFVGTVEGFPTLDNVIPKLKEKGIKEVTLMPYMLVAGDHANNDMAGDEEDSWKSILKKEGFVVNTYLHGLGENTGYQEIYVKHAKEALENK